MYSNIPLKKIKKDIGPLISFLLVTSRIVMKHARIDLKWHKHSPIFNNFALLIGNAPVSFLQWKDKCGWKAYGVGTYPLWVRKKSVGTDASAACRMVHTISSMRALSCLSDSTAETDRQMKSE